MDGDDSDTFCISATLRLVSADNSDMDESCSGKHIATYVKCNAMCHGNIVVHVSVAAAEKTQTGFFVVMCTLAWTIGITPIVIQSCSTWHD